ncbi:hypothetical protein GGI07_005280 [Coemansia sp. Benny D115]|nr:hypothetical protein GGI07_005280 [Coemansia sp. Benny D115]
MAQNNNKGNDVDSAEQRMPAFRFPTEEEKQAKIAQWSYLVNEGYHLVEDDDESNGDEKAPDVNADSESKTIRLSKLPTPVRVIKPGSRVTRDLRTDRLNIICNENGLITRILIMSDRHNAMDRVTSGMSLDEVTGLLGSPSSREGNVCIWECPGHSGSTFKVTFEGEAVSSVEKS